MKRFAQISITIIILISLFIPSGLEFAGQQISRVGEARAADYAWIAYNDVVFRAGQLETDITKYTISSEATSSGLLVDYSTGSNTAVNVAVTTSGTVSYSGTGDSDGTESTEGTDAYNTFHGIVNPIGLIYWSSSTPYLDLTFTNLSAGKTYTFATTANRAGSTTDYQSRISKFTISGIDSATNSSTSTVTEIDPYSVRFSTGENTAAGNVARWTGINPGTDNSFSVRIQGYSSSTSYGPSVFMLAEEAGSTNTAPDAPTLVTPEDNATGVGIPASLQVTVTDPDADIMDVSFYGRPVAAETPAEDFLLIAIPDTQTITQSYPATLTAQFQWIANRYTSPTGDDLVFVTSLGDIVQTANSTTQWQAADAAFDLLDTAGVPYSVGPGNHDEAIYSSTTYYSTYFGSSRFTGKSWYQGYYTGGEDNYNNYSFFTAGGMDFILINLEYDAGTGALGWADGLLKTHSDKRGIVVQHNLLNVNNTWQYQATYDALKDNPNLFLMLCGHMHNSGDGSAYLAAAGDDGHTIHVLLTDYQDFGDNDYLRLLTFKPGTNEIYAQVYSPKLGTYRTNANDYEQFTMAYDMEGSGVAPFELIGTATGVASGGTASTSWAGLSTGVEYEWYAVASDGSLSTTSGTWSFTGGTGTANLAVNQSSMTFPETEVGSFSELSYTISGSFLVNDVQITAPENFLVSTSSGSGFTSSLTLPLVSGAISETVYVRFTPQTAGELGGTITNISNPQANVVVSGTAITPTVNLCDYALLVATEDTYINGSRSYRNTNYGSSTELTVDGDPDASALLKWDFSSIPANATIDGADLIVYETDTNGSDDYEIYQLLRDWVEGDSSAGSGADWFEYGTTADWQTAGAQGSNDRSTTVLGTLQGTSGAGDKTASLNTAGIDLLQGWYDGSINNYGIIIQDYAKSGGIDFASSENDDYSGPRLNVHYCVESTEPTIVVTPDALSFYALPSTVSDIKTYTVSGYNLEADITITPPTLDFEISTDGVTFTNSPITLTQTGGIVSETPIYVRMKSLAVGTYSGSISHTSGTLIETVNLTGVVSESYLGMVINGDIATTGSQQVILDMSFGGATPTTMRFQNVPDGTACPTGDTGWSTAEDYSATASWTLSGTTSGTYKVCAQASLDGTTYTLAAEDTIDLQTDYTYPNPDLTASCGLDIVLVIDLSSSISSAELVQYKAALTSFVTALQNTPTNVSLVTFNLTAQILDLDPNTAGVQDWVRLSPTTATTINDIINALTTGTGTNWDDALRKARLQFEDGTDPSDAPDMIVFATDGDPSTWGGHDGDTPPTPSGSYATMLTYAIPEAEEAKAAGIHMLGLGIGISGGSVTRLQAISGSEAFVPSSGNITTADYYVATTFGTELTDALSDLVISLCGGSVTVNKVITTSLTDRLNPANWIVTANDPVLAGWQFKATVTSTDDSLDETSPSKTTTNAGNVNFKVNLGGDLEATLDIVEDTVKDYYTFVGAVCSIDGVSTPVVYEISTRTVTGIPVQNNELTNCTFVNFNPRDPTGVVLGSFVANSLPGGVMLTWETFSETNTLGFKLYRSATQDGERVPLNNGDMILTLNPPSSTSGAVYSFFDPDVLPGETYYYWLQEYSLDPFMVNEEKAVSVTCWWNWLFLPLITK